MSPKKESTATAEEGWEEANPDFLPVVKLEEVGDQVTATYTGARVVEVEDPNAKGKTKKALCHDFTAIEPVVVGDAEIPAGEGFSIWGTYKLDDTLPGNEGAATRITFLGKQDLEGGKEVGRYKIEFKK